MLFVSHQVDSLSHHHDLVKWFRTMEVDLLISYWLLGFYIRSLTVRGKDNWLVPGKASRIGSAGLAALDGVSDEKPTRDDFCSRKLDRLFFQITASGLGLDPKVL